MDDRPGILLVDDEPDNIHVLKTILQDDYRLQVAKSGKMAISRAAGEVPPDLILLDVMMPEMDGLEVCRRLKARKETADIPVIMVTSRNMVTDHARGFEAGAVDYIAKPVIGVLLKARIRTQLALHSRQKELAEKLAHNERELELARSIQRRFTPEIVPESPDFDLSFRIRQKRAIGGDYLDFFSDEQRRIGILLADVSGHGIPAALLAAFLKAVSFKITTVTPAGPFLSQLNNELCEITGENFVTILLGILDPATRTFTFINAGQSYPVHYRKNRNELETYRDSGTALGLFRDTEIPAPQSIALEPGDRLFLYTDGVTEITARDGRPIEEKIRASLLRDAGRRIDDIIAGFTDIVLGETDDDPPDDLTMIGISLHGD